ncbi:toxin-antitoxin system [Mycobacterium asiaticum]|uniref:toxin-antitoxin system n=1 Tax=Mycobacterium asiaticum TaxID=1790 RepID=UPI0009BF9D9E|nr:toxin-antitoxin system [Mycobacterium asiaticum]
MAHLHKGPRKLIMCRPVEQIYDEAKAEAARRGISLSQLVADVMALRYGRDDLVRELHRHPQGLPLAI